MEECHRRVGRVGPEHLSSRRGRGEQRRPLRRRVGNMGACPPPLRGRSAVLSPNAACTSGGPKIDSHVDVDLTAAWRHHVSMPPSSRSQSAAITALAGGTCELFRASLARNPTVGFWGAVDHIPQVCSIWILLPCLHESSRHKTQERADRNREQTVLHPHHLPRQS